jgi:Flp pilus assembly pilin Flp
MPMFKLLKEFAQDEDGLEMVEWAVVGALVTGIAAATLNIIGATLNLSFITLLGNVNAG